MSLVYIHYRKLQSMKLYKNHDVVYFYKDINLFDDNTNLNDTTVKINLWKLFVTQTIICLKYFHEIIFFKYTVAFTTSDVHS